MREPIRLSFFHDVLCAFCQVAAERVRRLEEEFGDLLVVELRPFALRPEEAAPSPRDLRRQVRLVKRASREPEGATLRPRAVAGDGSPVVERAALLAAEAARCRGARHSARCLIG